MLKKILQEVFKIPDYHLEPSVKVRLRAAVQDALDLLSSKSSLGTAQSFKVERGITYSEGSSRNTRKVGFKIRASSLINESNLIDLSIEVAYPYTDSSIDQAIANLNYKLGELYNSLKMS